MTHFLYALLGYPHGGRMAYLLGKLWKRVRERLLKHHAIIALSRNYASQCDYRMVPQDVISGDTPHNQGFTQVQCPRCGAYGRSFPSSTRGIGVLMAVCGRCLAALADEAREPSPLELRLMREHAEWAQWVMYPYVYVGTPIIVRGQSHDDVGRVEPPETGGGGGTPHPSDVPRRRSDDGGS